MKKIFSIILILLIQMFPVYSRDISKMDKFKAVFNNGAIDENDELWVWGNNNDEIFGFGDNKNRLSPTMIIENVEDVITNNYKTVVLKKNNELWGYTPKLRLYYNPEFEMLIENVKSAVPGNIHSMAIDLEGGLWGWGITPYGEIGDGRTLPAVRDTIEKVYPPVKIMDGIAQVSVGSNHTMAIDENGVLWGWGRNNRGQLGDGTLVNKATPQKIMEGVKSVLAAADKTMVINEKDELWVWGSNEYSYLGDGGTEDRPVPFKLMDDVKSISYYFFQTAVIKNNGELWSWGNNFSGEIGDGTTKAKLIPVKILDDVKTVMIGSGGARAIKNNNELWGWGYNENGEYGNGTTEGSLIPIKLMENIKSASPNGSHIINMEGELWGWGYNKSGGIGDGTTEDRHSPVKLTTFSSDWAREEVEAALNNKIISDETYVNFNENITREDFCKLAVAMIEAKTGRSINDFLFSRGVYKESEFTDTDDYHILAANELGIVKGVGNNLFRPKNPITREEAAIMLTRTAQRLELRHSSEIPVSFSDKDKIADWADYYVSAISCYLDKVTGKRVMEGTEDNKFNPKGYYTREQAIITFNRLFGAIPDYIYHDISYITRFRNYPFIITKIDINADGKPVYTGYIRGDEVSATISDINSEAARLNVGDVVFFCNEWQS